MVYLGAGTKNSPIAIDDDSEDEVVYELSSSRPQAAQYSIRDTPEIAPQQPCHETDTYQRSSSAGSWLEDGGWTPSATYTSRDNESSSVSASNGTSYPSADLFILDPYAGGKRAMAEYGTAEDEPPPYWPSMDLDNQASTKKRKRVGSFSQDMSAPGPSKPRETSHQSLANRLSQPESKKARKRRRRAERQAIEEARLQNSAWAESLTNPGSNVDIEDLQSWDGLRPSDSYFSRDSPPPNGSWTPTIADAAEDSIVTEAVVDTRPHWSFPSVQNPAPPVQPPPPVPPPQPAAKHTLPPKPPPPQPVPPIGMKPDQDPNSKHGVFHPDKTNKEAGTDMKKRDPNLPYIPNPARTLVMEQLPKTHRNIEFVYKWSKSACGALPIHLFIDVPSAKALLEFATAELARKAWSSPKLGLANLALKSHQLKGKPREDQIKVWWYRVDGVGAGAGVGEIEEGEIEGDSNAGDREPAEHAPPKETKKERKARLAREREEKRKVKEQKLTSHQPPPRQPELQQQQQQQPLQLPAADQEMLQASQMQNFLTPTLPFYTPTTTAFSESLMTNTLNALAPPFTSMLGSYFPGMMAQGFSNPSMPLWIQQPPLPTPVPQGRQPVKSQVNEATNKALNKSAFGASLNKEGHSDNESIASSAAASTSPVLSVKERVNATKVQQRPPGRARVMMVTRSLADVEDGLSDHDEDGMDVDNPAVAHTNSTPSDPAHYPPPRQPVGFNSLPAKPMHAPSGVVATAARPQTQHPSSSLSVSQTRGVRAASSSHVSRELPSQQSQAYPAPQQQPRPSVRPPAAPRAKHPQQQLPVVPHTSLSTPSIIATTSSSSSSTAGSSRSTPVPSEPKAMRVRVPAPSLAPPVTSTSTAGASTSTQAAKPSMTKEALLARQRELEERIARSKQELAAAAKSQDQGSRTATPAPASASGNGAEVIKRTQESSQAVSGPDIGAVKPAMDLGQNQAMEDLLRKKVLLSQKARAVDKFQSDAQRLTTDFSGTASPMSNPEQPWSATTSTEVPPSSSSSLSETGQQKKSGQTTSNIASSTISVSSSSHSFSLDDLAVSFITQTIEGAKSQPRTPAVQSSVPITLGLPTSSGPVPRPPSQLGRDSTLDLAAKQRRLEQHIAETKALMVKLTQARTKGEKDEIRKVMKEKDRLFEEESKASAVSNDVSAVGTRSHSQASMTTKATTMTHQFQITRWPVSGHNAGVLILSDDDESEDDGDDEDGAA